MAKADKTKNAAKKKNAKAATVKTRTPVPKKKSTGGSKSVVKKSVKQADKRKTASKPQTGTQKKAPATKTITTKTPATKPLAKSSPSTKSAKKDGGKTTARKSERNMASTEELRSLLLDRRNGILKNFDQDMSDDHDASIIVGDVADIAQGSSENELSFQLAEVESRELGQIDKAIEKINEGTYGVCEICGENISLARLKALPFANKCIHCQEADEQSLHY